MSAMRSALAAFREVATRRLLDNCRQAAMALPDLVAQIPEHRCQSPKAAADSAACVQQLDPARSRLSRGRR
jgi:hypothetical protein